MSATGDDGERNMDEGYLSDDSSFYGSSPHRTSLENRAATFDPSHYWSTHNNHPSVIAFTTTSQTSKNPSQKPYNPYEGSSAGRQLSETVTAFLSRLPPLTTHVDTHGPWIYIAYPLSKSRPTDSDLAGLKVKGQEVIADFEATRAGIEASMAGKAKSAIGRKVTPLRKQLETDLYAAAKQTGCMSGKWMLFPMAEDVNRIWALVATAVAEGELGHAAKVATDEGSGNVGARLICVYTEDYSDREDVLRVLRRLDGMGLVKGRGAMGEERGIYYKADAFTHLGVDSKNEWGLKASLFASKDVLAEGKSKGKA